MEGCDQSEFGDVFGDGFPESIVKLAAAECGGHGGQVGLEVHKDGGKGWERDCRRKGLVEVVVFAGELEEVGDGGVDGFEHDGADEWDFLFPFLEEALSFFSLEDCDE